MIIGSAVYWTLPTVAEAKAQFRAGRRRVYRPWVTEPGLWIQYDFGDGPTIAGRKTILWCAWLAWSRFGIVIPIWDKTLPTVTSCLDATFRRIGGVPAYVLTDNEKTVTTDRVAGIAVRNPEVVEVARHYGTTIRTCLPADPETKGGSEATVRIAKADLVPKDVNLREHYKSFGELEAACTWRGAGLGRGSRSTVVPDAPVATSCLATKVLRPGAPASTLTSGAVDACGRRMLLGYFRT